jgi:hypothetical protein
LGRRFPDTTVGTGPYTAVRVSYANTQEASVMTS